MWFQKASHFSAGAATSGIAGRFRVFLACLHEQQIGGRQLESLRRNLIPTFRRVLNGNIFPLPKGRPVEQRPAVANVGENAEPYWIQQEKGDRAAMLSRFGLSCSMSE
jgi:hypothetical protein